VTGVNWARGSRWPCRVAERITNWGALFTRGRTKQQHVNSKNYNSQQPFHHKQKW
jgi:hypothetical protein